MTREIKFRAYVPEFAKMVDVFAVNSMSRTVYLSHQQLFGTAGDDVLMSYAEPRDERDNLVKLMQYAGLKDRIGLEIYEGDIVKSGTRYSDLDQKNGMPAYEVIQMTHGCYEPLCYFKDGTLEVAGNIYENPELLNA